MSSSLNQSDSSFLKRFAVMIALLALVSLGLGALSHFLDARTPTLVNPDQKQQAADRIAPVGGVYAGDTGRAAMAAATAAASASSTPQAAYGGTTDGKQIFDHLCGSCHQSGIAGAPKVGDKADWAARQAEGEETLVTHAIDGYTGKTGVMPARGGNPALTDEQVKAAVDWMLGQLH